MKPIVICRFASHEGPGYFATYLTRSQIAWRVLKIDEGEPLPAVQAIAGLAMMGGPMSVNDDSPWIAPLLNFVRAAVQAEVPVIGHCLGGQLLAKALGAEVTRNPVKEIGWARVDILDAPEAPQWGPAEPFVAYHWHGETFAIPPGAARVWSSAHCANQAFALGPHFGMQCHVEMTAELVLAWCEIGAREIERNVSRSPAVQTAEAMRESLETKLAGLNRVADRVYARWTERINRGNS